MRQWLTIDVVLAVLVVTSFTCTGLGSLWAATSPRHWFVRAAVLLVFLSPLLLVPAYELFVVFLIEGVVVAGGVKLYRWRMNRHARGDRDTTTELSARATSVQFSLSTLLLVTILVAVGIPIAVRLPFLTAQAWGSVALDGTLCGVATLLAAWMFVSRRKWIAWPLCIALCGALGIILCFTDSFIYGLVYAQEWPLRLPTLPNIYGREERTVLVWAFAIPLIALLSYLFLFLWLAEWPMTTSDKSNGVDQPQQASRRILTGRLATVLVLLAIGAFPTIIVWKLLHRLPVPHPALPQPNGYDDIVAAGKITEAGSPILNTAVEPTSTAQLAAEVAKYSHAYKQLRLGMSRPCQVPVWPADGEPINIATSLPDIQAIRGAGRALMREAELARQQNRFADAARISIDIIRVGQASTRGGILMHYLVGVAVEGIGEASLYPAIAGLNAGECRRTIAALQQAERDREPLEAIQYRERIVSENALGWFGHFMVLLEDIVGSRGFTVQNARDSLLRRYQTIDHLLMTEAALRAYQLEHGTFPESLNELVPQLLDQVLTDPYDAKDGPLRYRRQGAGYVLYSVGFDGKDNGGNPPTPKNESAWDETTPADLRLDAFFAPDEPASPTIESDKAANNAATP
jgi:hypothetical protein